MSYNWDRQTLLITGASSGLGRALALATAKRGGRSMLIARNKERLEKVRQEVVACGGTTATAICDLSETKSIPESYRVMKEKALAAPSILINNAGYNAAGFVWNTPPSTYLHNYQVNVLAPVVLIQCALPDMLAAGYGYIVNIMSAAMYHSFPGISSYCSSKFAIGTIHESLKTELAGLPVNTLYVNPGGFQSNYWQHMDKKDRLGTYQHPKRKKDRDASEVAEGILNAIEQHKEAIDLSGWMDRVGYHLNYWLPSLVDRLLVRRNAALLAERGKSLPFIS